MSECQNCGTKFTSKYCPECGKPANEAAGQPAVTLSDSTLQPPAWPEPPGSEEPIVLTTAPAPPIYTPPAQPYAQTQSYAGQPAQGYGQQPNMTVINITNEQSNTAVVANQAAPAYVPAYMMPYSLKSRTAALLLCFFFGVFGVHRFYAGKVGTGILYLFTGGLFGIGWLVDLIMILVGGFRDSNGLPMTQW